MSARQNSETHRQTEIANAITGTFWCMGGMYPAPMEMLTTYRGKKYCTTCEKRVRARNAMRRGR